MAISCGRVLPKAVVLGLAKAFFLTFPRVPFLAIGWFLGPAGASGRSALGFWWGRFAGVLQGKDFGRFGVPGRFGQTLFLVIPLSFSRPVL